ncbi:unnamed protein product, partial [Rotaria sp. Silwood1]
MISIIRIPQPSLLLKVCRYNSSSITSSFDHHKKPDVKTHLLSLLIELRDKDIPKLDSRITSLLNVAKQSIPLNKFNTSFKNIETLLSNDITKLKYDIDQLIISLQYIPVQNFDSNKIDQFLLLNEKIDRQCINASIIHNVFQDLVDVIDDLWIAKRSKLKFQSTIADVKLLLERLQEENIDLKVSVSHLHKEDTFQKYQSCVSELMRHIIQSIKKEFRRKLEMEYISENFDQATFESLLNDPQHEEIKENLNLDDNQIDLILTIFDKICSKYGFPNKTILAQYLLIVSIRNQREHDRMDSYIKLSPDDQRSFAKYCEKNNLIDHYQRKDHILLESLFT